MEVIYLAAGRGSRLGGKTSKIPKCLVKVNGKSIMEHNYNFLNKFKKVNIITGYKSKLIFKQNKIKRFKILKNEKYSVTNMVYSSFVANPSEKEIVICYGDIIFDEKIFNLIKNSKRKNLVLINSNWLKYWKKRMTKSQIFKDAEDIKINRNKKLLSIGGKIKKLPRFQYMGIIKLENKNYFKLKNFFSGLKNNIDYTNFLNKIIDKKILNLYCEISNLYWFEIDSPKDIKVAEKLLPK